MPSTQNPEVVDIDFNTEYRSKPSELTPDEQIRLSRFKERRLAAAVWDDLGAAVEFYSLERIRERFGEAGLTDYASANGCIPPVESKADFVGFSKPGRALAQLHLDHEKISPYPDLEVTGEESGNFRVAKLRFAETGDASPAKLDRDAIEYNGDIVASNIPAKAYDYVTNGKSAIEWIIERYQYKQDPASEFVNDPDNWSDEVGNSRYILDRLLSIVNVSVQTVDIVKELPKISFT